MSMYKCEEPGCDKYFSSKGKLNRHKSRVHGATPGAAPAVPAATPDITPPGLKIKKPETRGSSPESGGYHCNDCGAAVKKGQEICPGCGEQLIWKGVE